MSRALRRASIVAAVLGPALVLAALLYAVPGWRRPAPICLAFANSLTGPSGSAGTESLVAARIHLDEVNAAGGVDGRRIELKPFDDASSAEAARDNVQAIADSPCLAVLGHYLSTASLAAGTGYKFVGIPALTGTSFVDDLTFDNEFYFRAQTTSSVQGRSIAEYLRAVMKAPVVHLVYSRDRFGRSFVRGFAQGYQQQHVDAFAFEVDPEARAGSIRELAETLAGQPEPGIIVVGTGADFIAEVVIALRRRGLTVPIMTAGGAGREEFLQGFANEPEETQHPGFFSERLYASPPLIFDSAGAAAQAFAAEYTRRSGRAPDWIAAGAYDATRVMVEALRRAGVRNRPETKEDDRARVRAALARIDGPKTAVPGLTGPLFFDANRDMPNAVRVGFFRRGRFVTAPLQLVPVDHPDATDLAAERDKGRVVSFGTRHYWLQRAVYTGIDVNRVNRIDVRQGSFNIDFYLWMRFAGDDDAPTRVEFPALLDKGAFDPAHPAQTGREDGLNYRLYRIAGDVKASFDLHDYPFDVQTLRLHLQNTEQRRELVTYVIDRFGLRLADERSSVVEDGAYAGLQLLAFRAAALLRRRAVERLDARQAVAVRRERAHRACRVQRRHRAAPQLRHLHPQDAAAPVPAGARRVRDAVLPGDAVPGADHDPGHGDPDERRAARLGERPARRRRLHGRDRDRVLRVLRAVPHDHGGRVRAREAAPARAGARRGLRGPRRPGGLRAHRDRGRRVLLLGLRRSGRGGCHPRRAAARVWPGASLTTGSGCDGNREGSS